MATGPATVSAAAHGDEAMWLNITAAKVICAMCIGIGTWLVYQSNPGEVVIRSPLEPLAQVLTEAPLAGAATPVHGAREELVRRFDRPNAMDRQLAMNLESGAVYVRSAPEPEPVELPPLLLPAPQPLVVAAAPEPAAIPEPAEAAEPPPAEVVLAAAAEPAPEGTIHRVAKGERLVRIAERYYGSRDARQIEALLEANPGVRARQGRLLAGESLRIPALGASARAAADVSAAPSADATLATASPRWYTIQAKDSLSGIARRFLSDPKRWPEIARLNGKLDPNKIVPGMRIKLPPAIVAAAR